MTEPIDIPEIEEPEEIEADTLDGPPVDAVDTNTEEIDE